MAEFFHPTLVWGPARGNPLECCNEIWRQKTKIVELPDGEEIFVLTIPARDGQTRYDRKDPR